MIALPNLLSHPTVRPERMSATVGGRTILRSAKDLGRVLSLAHLSSRDEVEGWLAPRLDGLEACFPHDWRELAQGAGSGHLTIPLRPVSPVCIDEAGNIV